MIVSISVRSMWVLLIVRLGMANWSAAGGGPPGESRTLDVPDLLTDQVELTGLTDDVDHPRRRTLHLHLDLLGLEAVQRLTGGHQLTFAGQPFDDGSLGHGHAGLRDLDRGSAPVRHASRYPVLIRSGPWHGSARRSESGRDSAASPTPPRREPASTPRPGVRRGRRAHRTGRARPSTR